MRKLRISQKLKCIISFAVCLSVSVSLWADTVSAQEELPYTPYNYDYWEEAHETPAAYAPYKSYSGQAVGLENGFSSPGDIYILENGDMYICDTGNNRVVLVDRSMKLKQVIETIKVNGKEERFNGPQGLYVKDSDHIYVADTGNHRVLLLSASGEAKQVFEDPKSDNLAADFVFVPQKIAVDDAGRLYVVAQNAFEGMMCFSEDGEYTGYFGTNRVAVNALDLFWRRFATKEQRSKMLLYIPAEFTNLDIDEDGFVYTTDIDYESDRSIKRFNPSSVDVLKNYNVTANTETAKTDLIGDLDYPLKGNYEGRSTLVDIKYRGNGIYSVLDSKRGRIISYDSEGNILYIFGGIGSQFGMLKKPAAIECYGEYIYVLDQQRAEIVCYRATDYGSLINEGTSLRYDGDEASAVRCWEQVLKLDPNCMAANVGIGKSLLADGRNREAMYYLEAGMDRRNYSIAFKRYRTDVMKKAFPYAISALAVIIAAVFVRKRYRRRKHEKEA